MKDIAHSIQSIIKASPLPVDAVIQNIFDSTSKQIILEAPTGSGKSTRLPLHLIHDLLVNYKDEGDAKPKKIIMLEPRRIAAKSIAHYLAQQINQSVGGLIGYRIKQETKVSNHTLFEVVTEGILNQIIQNDPELTDYQLVLFDEFHERSVQADLSLALTLESQAALREDLNIIVMSATLDGLPLERILTDSQTIKATGRQYPVNIEYRPPSHGAEWLNHCVQVIAEEANYLEGHCLVFLPGAREINYVFDRLNDRDVASTIEKLYGGLSIQEQRRITSATESDSPKIILSTNVAETSLTIPGVTLVIDSGFVRQNRYDTKRHFDRLETMRISKSSANQRAGRAGRLGPGRCIRLFSEDVYQHSPYHDSPEITRVNPTPLALSLASWGDITPNQYFLDTPSEGLWQYSLNQLVKMDLVTNGTYAITTKGKLVNRLPIDVHCAALIANSQEDTLTLNILLATAIDKLLKNEIQSMNLLDAIENDFKVKQEAKVLLTRLHKQSNLIGKPLPNEISNQVFDHSAISKTLIVHFPHRLAKRISDKEFLTAEGWRCKAPAKIHLQSQWICLLAGHEFIQGYIPIDDTTLNENLASVGQWHEQIMWNDALKKVQGIRILKLGQIEIQQQPLTKLTDEQIKLGLINSIESHGLALLEPNDTFYRLIDRINFLHSKDTSWPHLDESVLITSLDQWFLPFLTNITSFKKLKEIDLPQALLTLLPWEQQQALDHQAPNRWRAPSGNQVTLDYSNGQPVAKIKLQEMFGTDTTPTVGSFKEPIEFHLLSPAGRPVQITRDLISFWKNGYPEVRKELRIRYAKHPWPEDPMTAEATAKTKKQLQRP